MESTARAQVTIDQEAAVATSIGKLAREFEGSFGRETVERFLHSSYAELAATATVPNYLPLLTEKFARQRLRALARVEGDDHRGRRRSCRSHLQSARGSDPRSHPLNRRLARRPGNLCLRLAGTARALSAHRLAPPQDLDGRRVPYPQQARHLGVLRARARVA